MEALMMDSVQYHRGRLIDKPSREIDRQAFKAGDVIQCKPASAYGLKTTIVRRHCGKFGTTVSKPSQLACYLQHPLLVVYVSKV